MMAPILEGIYLNMEVWAWREYYRTLLFLSFFFVTLTGENPC
jgi:hypothetical protein